MLMFKDFTITDLQNKTDIKLKDKTVYIQME